jgi:hypothetical protein
MRNRKLGIIGALLVAAALAAATVSATSAQTQPAPGPGGMMGGTGTTGSTTGPGPMGQGGVNGGQGMMGGQGAQQATPIGSLDAAKQAFEGYVERTGNPDLALDEVMQFQWNYYAIVKEKSTGTGAFELLADPRTGAIFPEMGPNMMWNTKYSPMATFGGGMMGGAGGFAPGGMMSGTWGPTAPTAQPTVTADQATQVAQQWLDQYQAGSATETPDSFPGYYTLHITKDGQISGMLSVNAFTGQVWYHTWHGTFVASSEA